uniref:Uncharacterized protein n=1 Tax=Romanomermis culicivorax TaxID=13658 RepID=A0A915IPB9_ROMCU
MAGTEIAGAEAANVEMTLLLLQVLDLAASKRAAIFKNVGSKFGTDLSKTSPAIQCGVVRPSNDDLSTDISLLVERVLLSKAAKKGILKA